jgi:hypothetical protein
MPLTRLDNLISSKTGKYLYVSPDDFNATDALSNRGNSPITPFKSIQRAFLEIARYSYLPGFGNDRFDQFSIMLMPGIHYIDNRPGLVDTSGIDTFGFDQALNAWTDNSILDISNPNNVLYKFNNTEGGAIIPRGSSLVGYDLRRTTVRPLYVPDPASVTVPRSAIFNVTGGCYFWQFTIKDGQTTSESPLYDNTQGTGLVYYDPNDFTRLAAPNFSHHKLTIFEYADQEELGLFYRKIAKAFSAYQPTIDDPGEFDFNIQENRIVGPLSDSRVIESLTLTDATTKPSIPASTSEIEVTTKVNHGYFQGQFVAISGTEIDSILEGIFPIKSIDQNDPRKFTYEVPIVVSAIGTNLVSGQTVSVPTLGQNAQTLAEVDSVESASPYVFNCSIRSTWGICGIWANGLKATGFKSMVIAQYTGVSLQKDDRAFIRYDEYSNTWNQASLVDAFATIPYHAKGDSYWKDDWRNFHVRASDDAFIQNVSIFAVGFADHFLMESGGDMSITNSNSNFGNTSLHAIGFKGFAFNQDKGGFITDIIPPQRVLDTEANTKKLNYYVVDIKGTNENTDNYTKLFLGSNDIITPIDRPAVTIDGFRLGAKTNEKLYVKLDPSVSGGTEEFNVTLEPTGFVKYVASASILNPSGFAINNLYADAANLIEKNRRFIQEEVFGYIIEKYPRLRNIPYVNPGLDPESNRYYDARNLIISNRQEIIDTTLIQTNAAYPGATISAISIGELIDSIAEDLRDGGNFNTIEKVKQYFDGTGTQIEFVGQEQETLFAFNRARDLCKLATANLLSVKADLYDPNPNSEIAGYQNSPNGTTVAGYTGSEAEEQNLTTNGVTIDAANAVDPAGRYKDARNLIIANRDYILDNALAEIAVYHPDFYIPGDTQTNSQSRFADAYRLIRRNQTEIEESAIQEIVTVFPGFQFPNSSSTKCQRDIGYFIEAVALDMFVGGNEWTSKFTRQYFDAQGNPIVNGLVGEEAQSIVGFNAARDGMIKSITNQLTYKDLTVTAGESEFGDGNGTVPNTDLTACADVQSAITTLSAIATDAISAGDTNTIPAFQPRTLLTGETKCRRDIGYIVDAIAQDLWFGGNEYTIAATKEYFYSNSLIVNGVDNETAPSITAFKRVADAINSAINNKLYEKDPTITLDNTGEPPFVSYINADAHDLVLKNKEFIAKEAYERMKAAYPSYAPQTTNTEQDCLDDVYDVLEQVMYDVKFGGNGKTYDAANIYVTNIFNGQAIETFIDSERDEAARVFTEVKAILPDIIRNNQVVKSPANQLDQVIDNTIVDDWETPACSSAISAADTLLDIIIQAIGTDAGVGNLTGITRTSSAQPSEYVLNNCSDVLSTVDTLVGIVCDALDARNLETLPPLSNGNWDCANVRSSIENLFDIVTDSIDFATLTLLPDVNRGDFIINAVTSKCFRDVTYIVDGVVNDLRLGGNINCIQVAEAYYVGNQLEYIDGEKVETLDAWNYTGQLAIAAMRNFDFLTFNCQTQAGSAIVDVLDTRGIVVGMSVKEYDNTDPVNRAYVNGLLQPGANQLITNIPAGTFVKRIISNTEIELGVANSRFDFGATVNALQTSNTVNLYFALEKGQWADSLPKTVTVGPESSNPDVIQDTTTGAPGSPTQRECAGVANAIDTLVGAITTIISSGLGSVARQEQTVSTSAFAARATVFTIDTTGYGASNPHNFETGTPVRLVPRPRFDVTTRKYVDVDKRLVRLPNGFETNRTYYVIAPGRRTQPENYSNTTFFDGSDQTKLMLATSKENAAAGIYIYSAETDSIDKDVQIDIYQFVLDEKYDLHNYRCQLTNSVTAGIETEVSHIFDVPFSSVTPQKVFFREIEGGVLPLVSTTYENDVDVAITNPLDADVGRISPNKEFFARYQNDKVFTIHKTYADAINNVNPITFSSGQTGNFQVFANKRRSPVRFDPGFTDAITSTGKWFIQCKDEGSPAISQSIREENIFWRLKQIDYLERSKTTDTWFTRLDDRRDKNERTYKLRYVIPKYLENARDPINGFVIKTRTDDTRKLVPQKVLLKPVAGTVYGARFENPVQAGEFIGVNEEDFVASSLNKDLSYDPYRKDITNQGIEYRAFARFSSGVQATIQSGRYIQDNLDTNIKYLELTLFDHTIDSLNFPGLRNETLTTVKITAPQGGEFVTSKTQSIAANQVEWTGNSSGIGNIHGYYSIGGDHYLILKSLRGGKLEFSEFFNTRFTQGNVFADMVEDQDMGKSLPLKTLIRKGYPEYYYKQDGSNVYTITPGDRIQDDAGVEYFVDSVEDAGVIEDTFYVFSYETLQRRIAGQQDGIYYLSCLRGNISPFPTGAGVGDNFRKFKFSQPVSSLYPLNYKNDPLWFQKAGTTQEERDYAASLIDPPQSFSAADNYVQGLVTTNDFKNSVTRELVQDLINNPAFVGREYVIQAQTGNATSGSEDRRIPISGDSTVLADQRYYVELRRPSIARAGNHTFEYLGFGPGNYSTGLPARQEIVLTPTEDFYAQSKKEDGGIVFYTGLNSNGDLYIGNRKINAITGEETFLESAELVDSEDDSDDLDSVSTSFDEPVTFLQNITVVGGDGSLQNTFQSPLVISVQDNDLTEIRDSLIIRSNVSSVDPVTGVQQDEILDRTSFRPPLKGDIKIGKNRINAAVFAFNSRGNGQEYMFQTHAISGSPSNITPNNSDLVANAGTRLLANQFISYGGVVPATGDVLLKGLEVGRSGSLGWIYANYYQEIPNSQIFTIQFNGTNVVKLTFVDLATGLDLSNRDVGLTSGSQLRFSNFYFDPRLNLTWQIFSPPGDAYDPDNNYVYFQVIDQIAIATLNWNTDVIGSTPPGAPTPLIEFSNANWKEVGVLGAEAIRTETETIGDYKVGINTVARSSHLAAQNGFVSNETEPRANLDVVGNTFVSGKKILSYLTETGTIKTETNLDNAFLVGGNSANPSVQSVLRVMTTNGGRVGINTAVNDLVNPYKNLDRNLVVVGDGRVSGNFEITGDTQVNGGDITTTSNTFNFVNSNANIINIAGEGQILNVANNTTVDQNLNIGNSSTNQVIQIGNSATQSTLRIHRNSQNAIVDIASVSDSVANNCEVTIGGAWSNLSSFTKIGTRQTLIAGELEIGSNYAPGTSISRIFTQTRTVDLFDGDQTNTVNLATNATQFTLGSTGGSTTVRNTLNVLASHNVEGNIRLNGGLSAGIVKVERGRFNTTEVPHNVGGVTNPNIDFYKYEETGKVIDTSGTSFWGSTSFLLAGGQIAAIDNVINNGGNNRIPGTYSFLGASGGTGTGATVTITIRFDFTYELTIDSPGSGYTDNDVLTITNDQLGGGAGGGDFQFQVNGTNDAGTTYFLPISTPSPSDFRVGDLLLIDRANPASPNAVGVAPTIVTGLRNEAESEIVRVVGLANLSNPNDPSGYRVIVSRGQEGTGTYTNHPDGCVIAKLIKQSNASYITGVDLNNDGEVDDPPNGLTNSPIDVNVGVAEFGGIISTDDYLRLSGTEFVKIKELITTSPQTLTVNDGGSPAAEVFKVESTTGNTFVFGNLRVGAGYNKFTVDGNNGNTNVAGTLTTENTLKINGSTIVNQQFFTITNGGSSTIPLRTTFQIDTATGDIFSYGGSISIFNESGTTPRLEFDNSSGDFTTYGSFSALGTGESTFGGDLRVAGDVYIEGGDLTVYSGGTDPEDEVFAVDSDGSVTVAGIPNYFTRTGGPKWEYTSDSTINAQANVNYFVNAVGNTILRLPQNPLIGDTIRVIDISGNLTYNLTLVVRAPDNTNVQGNVTNTGAALLSSIPTSSFVGYNGGELIVQTPNAAFGLVYAGASTPDGNPGVPSSLTGWYLMDV